MGRAWSLWTRLVTAQPAVIGGAVAALLLVAAVGLSRVSFDENPVTIFKTDSGDFALLEEVNGQFDTDENDVIVVVSGADIISRESIAALRDLTERFSAIPGVDSTYSILNIKREGTRVLPLVPLTDAEASRYEQARGRALAHPLVGGQLLSPDARTTLVIVHLEGPSPPVSYLARVRRDMREAIDAAFEGTPLVARMAGHAAVRVDSLATLQAELLKFTMLSGAVAMVLGVVMLRRVAAMFIVVASSGIGVLWTVGLMGFLGERINGLNMVLPSLVFVIGFADAMHLMMHIQRARREGRDRLQAVVSGLERLGTACLLCALTTACGLGSLMVAQAESVQRFGLLCGIGSLLSFGATISVLPLLGVTRLGEQVVPRSEHVWPIYHVSGFPLVVQAQRYPKITWAASVAVATVLLATALQLRSDIHWTEAIPYDSETSQAMRKCDEAFGGALLAYVVVSWPQDADLGSPELYDVVDEVHAALNGEPLLASPTSVRNLLESLSRGDRLRPEQLSRVPEHLRKRVVRPDLRRLLISAHVPDRGAAALEPAFDRLERKLEGIARDHAGYQLQLTGTVVVAARNMRFVISDLTRSIATSAIVILGVLWIGFGSLRLAAIGVLPNAFPLLVTAAYLVVSGRPLQITSVLTFSLCLGLAVNDTVHFLFRLKQEQDDSQPLRSAVRASLDGVGPAMVASTVILTGGFASMLASDMPAISLFSELTCVTIVAALVGDLVALPATVLCFARETRLAKGRQAGSAAISGAAENA